MARATSRRTAAPATARKTHRRWGGAISRSSHAHALRTQPAFHLALDCRETLRRRRLVAGDKHWLRVRGANQSPAVAEQHAYAVHVNDIVLRAKMRDRFINDSELPLLRDFDTYLGCGYEVRNVREQLANRLPGIGQDAQQTRGAVQRVIVAVEAFTEEHVPRHLASDGRVRLLHLVLDEGVTRLPHDRLAAGALDGIRECLRAFHIEDDRLAGARAREHIARVENENPIAPHDFALLVDDADAVSVPVESDPDLGAVFLHRGDEILEIFGNRWIGVVIRERSVALAKNASSR